MTTLPLSKTLNKYGLTFPDWNEIFISQGCRCPICEKVPTTGRWVIDHSHIKGWSKLPPNERKKWVRGITCWLDNNKALTKGMTLQKARNMVNYLEKFENKNSP